MKKHITYFVFATLLGTLIGAAFQAPWWGALIGFSIVGLVYAFVGFIGWLFFELMLQCFDSLTGNKTTRRW